MKNIITLNFILQLIFNIPISLFSQSNPPVVQWQNSFGGTGDDEAYSMQQTIDGGYIVAGSSNSIDGDVSGNRGNRDYWVVKLDSVGNLQWEKSLGGSNDDEAYSIQQTSDYGYVVAGYSKSNDGDLTINHGSRDFWVVKLNSSGSIQWQKSFGGTNDEWASSIKQTIDGGYMAAGTTESMDGDVSGNHGNLDYWIVKLDSVGNIQWQKCYGGSGGEEAKSIQQTIDTGYIVVGSSDSNNGDISWNNGARDYWIVKLNNIGNIEWNRSLGGSDPDGAQSVSLSDPWGWGYIVGGFAESSDGDVNGHIGYNNDFWILQINPIGVVQWTRSLGGTSSDAAMSIQQTTDYGFIICGVTNSDDGDVQGNHSQFTSDYWIVKLNNQGSIEWNKCLGGSADEWASSIQQTSDSGYIVAGNSYSNDGDVTNHHGNVGSSDFWVVKLSPDITIGVDEITSTYFAVYPTITNGDLHIRTNENLSLNGTYKILDTQGRICKSGAFNSNTILVGELSPQLYFIQLITKQGIGNSKFIKE
ncbi:MAG: T9SS type A sorting domain-containing protein [Bacteroidetes bacterium]|nr:MAG: T9SS type A sorting domain-containing protein [Bacteroidota bacterium]